MILDEYVLEVKNLSKTYSGICVLDRVCFQLKPGSVHALVGENGAGKSTMIKAFCGVVKPDEGSEIYINGAKYDKMTPDKSISLGISVIYQDISLFPNLSIAENICKGLFPEKLYHKKKYMDFARKKLNEFGIEIDVRMNLKDISIGKQQLVAIARATAFKSKVIIMDEPTSALSSSETDKLHDIILKLKKNNTSIVYISHKLEEIFKIADEITVLRDGKHIISGPVDSFTNQSLIKYMVGRELYMEELRSKADSNNKVLLSVENFTKEPMFRNISFSVYEHEILGITGLVGAGRSEIAQAIFGLIKPDSGIISINGRKTTVRNAGSATKQGICYLPEDKHTQGLFYGHALVENVTITQLEKVLNRLRLINQKEEAKIAANYIESLNIKPPFILAHVERFSGGNQQKILMARWLNAKPTVLIVDEPTIGVDIGAKAEIHHLLRNLANEGVAIIMISSDLQEIMAVSDRILVVRSGEIVADLKTSNSTQEQILEKGLLG